MPRVPCKITLWPYHVYNQTDSIQFLLLHLYVICHWRNWIWENCHCSRHLPTSIPDIWRFSCTAICKFAAFPGYSFGSFPSISSIIRRLGFAIRLAISSLCNPVSSFHPHNPKSAVTLVQSFSQQAPDQLLRPGQCLMHHNQRSPLLFLSLVSRQSNHSR